MFKMISCILFEIAVLLNMHSFVLAQETEQQYGFGDYISWIIGTFGPLLLMIVFVFMFFRKTQQGQNKYFGEVLPQYTKKHIEHMDRLIDRLDKLIEILEKK